MLAIHTTIESGRAKILAFGLCYDNPLFASYRTGVSEMCSSDRADVHRQSEVGAGCTMWKKLGKALVKEGDAMFSH